MKERGVMDDESGESMEPMEDWSDRHVPGWCSVACQCFTEAELALIWLT